MDVRIPSLLISTVILAGCGNAGRFDQTFRDSSPQCADAAAKNRYIVKSKSSFGVHLEEMTRDELRDKYSKQDALNDVDVIEPDYNVTVFDAPVMDPTGDSNWGINSVNIKEAWSAGVYGQGITVAIIDSGLDINHPQLRNRLNINSAEASGMPGVDDDNNGFPDDVVAWNFGANSSDISDPIGHGTHVAGVIAADHTANSTDPKGIAPHAQVLPISFIDASGGGYISNAIQAIDYARDRGAQVINASWGGGGCSTILQQKIDALKAQGIIFVAASGNAGNNIDQILEFPASLNLSNQITVGSTDPSLAMSNFSNYGVVAVHLLAPGANIYSTFPGGYRTMSGTSMATPFVTGAVAILKSYRPQADYSKIKSALLNSVSSGNYPVLTRGRLNIAAALAQLSQ